VRSDRRRKSLSLSKVEFTRQLAASRHRNVPPLMGFTCLPEYYQPSCSSAYWVSTRPSSPFSRDHRSESAFGLEVPAVLPQPHIRDVWGHPLTGFGVPSEYHRRATANVRETKRVQFSRPRSFQGLVPYSVFPDSASHIPRRLPRLPVTLRPQGFSPSRRLAPAETCRACFIPVPLLGFSLRGFAPAQVPYALSSTATSVELERASRSSSLLRGLAHHKQSRPSTWGLARILCGCPLGLIPLRGFLLRPAEATTPQSSCPIPSRASLDSVAS